MGLVHPENRHHSGQEGTKHGGNTCWIAGGIKRSLECTFGHLNMDYLLFFVLQAVGACYISSDYRYL